MKVEKFDLQLFAEEPVIEPVKEPVKEPVIEPVKEPVNEEAQKIKESFDKFRIKYDTLKTNNDKLESRLEELEKSSMTEKEKAAFEKQKRVEAELVKDQILTDREKTLEKKELNIELLKELGNATLSHEWAEVVNVEKIEQITGKILIVKSLIDEERKAAAKQPFIDNGKPPVEGIPKNTKSDFEKFSA